MKKQSSLKRISCNLSFFLIVILITRPLTCMREENETCPICLEKITDETPAISECNHKAHYTCFVKWLSQSEETNCPHCRKKLAGTKFFFVDAHNKIIICDIETGKKNTKRHIEANPEKEIYKLEIIQKNILGVAYKDNQLDFFNIATSQKINKKNIQTHAKSAIRNIQLLPKTENKTVCVTHANKQIYLFDLENGTPIAHIAPDPENTYTIAGILRNNIFCFTNHNNLIYLFDITQQTNICTIQVDNASYIKEIGLLKDTLLCIKFENHTLELFDITTKQNIKTTAIEILKPDTDDEIICVTHTNNTIELYCTKTGDIISDKTCGLITNKDIRYIIDKDGTIDFFDTKTGQHIHQITLVTDSNKTITQLSIEHSAIICVIYFQNNTVDLYESIMGTYLISIETDPNKTIETIRIDNKNIYIQYTNSHLSLYKFSNGKKVNKNSIITDSKKEIENICVVQNKIVSVGYTDPTIDLFHKKSGEKLCRLSIKEEFVRLYFFNNQYVCLEYRDKQPELFDLYAKDKIKPNALYIISDYDETFIYLEHTNKKRELFNVRTGKKVVAKDIQLINQTHIYTIDNTNNIWLINIPLHSIVKNIQADKEKKIKRIVLLDDKTLCAEYTDHTIDLFDLRMQTKINSQTIQTNQYNTIAHIQLKQGVFSVRYSDNQEDLFKADTGTNITHTSIHNNRRKEIIKTQYIEKNTSCTFYYDGKIDLFNIKDNKKFCSIKSHPERTLKSIGCIINPKKEPFIYTIYHDGLIELFYRNNGIKLCSLHTGICSINRIQFIGKQHICVQYIAAEHKLFNIQTGKETEITVITTINYKGKKALCIQNSDGTLNLFSKTSGIPIKTNLIQLLEEVNRAYLCILDTNNALRIFTFFLNPIIDPRNTIPHIIQADKNKEVESIYIDTLYLVHVSYTDHSLDLFCPQTGEIIYSIAANENKVILSIHALSPQIYSLICSTNQIILFTLSQNEDDDDDDYSDDNETRKIICSIQIACNKEIERLQLLSEKYVYIQYKDHTADIFDPQTGAKCNDMALQIIAAKEIETIESTEDSILYITYTDKYAQLLSLPSGKLFYTNTNHENKILHIKSLNPKILYIRHKDNSINLFDKNNFQKINAQPIQANKHEQVQYSSMLNNKILCLQYSEKKIDLFDIQTGNQLNLYTIHYNEHKQIAQIHILKDNILYVEYMHNQMDLFNTNTGEILNQYTLYALDNEIIMKAGTLEKKIVYLIYQNNRIDFFDIAKSKKIGFIKTNPNKVITSIQLQSTMLIITYTNKELHIHDITQNAKRTNLHPIQLEENKTLSCMGIEHNILWALYADQQIHLFDIQEGVPIKTIQAELHTPIKKIEVIKDPIHKKSKLNILYEDDTVSSPYIYFQKPTNPSPQDRKRKLTYISNQYQNTKTKKSVLKKPKISEFNLHT